MPTYLYFSGIWRMKALRWRFCCCCRLSKTNRRTWRTPCWLLVWLLTPSRLVRCGLYVKKNGAQWKTAQWLVFQHLSKDIQSAYKRYHWTEMALLKIHNDIVCNMDTSKCTALTLLDRSAAFDTTDHDIPLQRLHRHFGISDTALLWFSSYLSDRYISCIGFQLYIHLNWLLLHTVHVLLNNRHI